MNLICETSYQTKKIVELFLRLSFDKIMSFQEATKNVGFAVTSTLSAYQSARRIARRDHKVIIDGVRNFGFKRLTGEETAKGRGDKHLKSMRNKSRIAAMEMEIALEQNLNEDTSREASYKLIRFRLLGDISKIARTNRAIENMPDLQNVVDVRAMLKNISDSR